MKRSIHCCVEQDLVSASFHLCQQSVQPITRRDRLCWRAGKTVLRDLLRVLFGTDLLQMLPKDQRGKAVMPWLWMAPIQMIFMIGLSERIGTSMASRVLQLRQLQATVRQQLLLHGGRTALLRKGLERTLHYEMRRMRVRHRGRRPMGRSTKSKLPLQLFYVYRLPQESRGPELLREERTSVLQIARPISSVHMWTTGRTTLGFNRS